MHNSTLYLCVFGMSYIVKPTVIDFSRKVFEVDPDDVVPFIPGFVAGASYVTCPLPKILEKIGCDWKVRKIVRIEKDKWRYEFQYLKSDWTIEMTVAKNYGKTFKG